PVHHAAVFLKRQRADRLSGLQTERIGLQLQFRPLTGRRKRPDTRTEVSTTVRRTRGRFRAPPHLGAARELHRDRARRLLRVDVHPGLNCASPGRRGSCPRKSIVSWWKNVFACRSTRRPDFAPNGGSLTQSAALRLVLRSIAP